jgi:hypothetical protein
MSFAPRHLSRWAQLPLAVVLTVALAPWAHATSNTDLSTDGNTAVAPARCGLGSRPETGLQGQVPLSDRLSGRSMQGYRCNLELVGQYQGEGSAVVSTSAGQCAFMATSYGAADRKKSPGVQVIDVSNPAKPTLAGALDSRAFHVGTWESLKTNPAGTMIAGAGVGTLVGAGKLDLYDVTDCTHPKLLNVSASTGDSQPVTNLAHEGEWSPDGKTYWTSATALGSLSAIDVSNPAQPKNLYFGGSTIFINHGMSFNADGTRMYLASIFPAGIAILDVSEIQNRKASSRRVRQLSRLTWDDGSVTQRALPVTIKGKPYLIAIDEIGGGGLAGGVHFIDISDELNPAVVSHIRLAIQLKENASAASADVQGNGIFGYATHYCSVDRAQEPTALACGYFQSGVRVFDIRDPLKAREIAYFNPPAQTGKNALLPGSDHAVSPALSSIKEGTVVDPAMLQALSASGASAKLTADWCSSPPQFVNNQLWVTCNDNGFMVLKFTNGAFPLPLVR